MRLYHVAFALLIVWTGRAQATDPLRPPAPCRSCEEILLDDAADGRLHELAPLRAALIASGVTEDDRFAAYERQWETLLVELKRDAAHDVSPRDRAATALALLHRQCLRGKFDPACDSIAATLDDGRYNCVTATLLYHLLAESLALPATIWHAPGHVSLRLNDGGAGISLEPTSATWLSQTKVSTAQLDAREISYTALLGKLYYNRGVQALEAKHFATAIACFRTAEKLDAGDAAARQNLLAALNNGALAHCDQHEFATARDMLDAAARLDPAYPPLAANDLHLCARWTTALCERGDYATASDLLAAARQRRPAAALLRESQVAVYRLWAEQLLRQHEPHTALARVEAGLALAPQDAELLRLKSQLRP